MASTSANEAVAYSILSSPSVTLKPNIPINNPPLEPIIFKIELFFSFWTPFMASFISLINSSIPSKS